MHRWPLSFCQAGKCLCCLSCTTYPRMCKWYTGLWIPSVHVVFLCASRLACYLSDDGASMLMFDCLAEAAGFARLWVPFCKRHSIEPRSPEAYFSQTIDFLKDKVQPDFVKTRRRVKVRSRGQLIPVSLVCFKRKLSLLPNWTAEGCNYCCAMLAERV